MTVKELKEALATLPDNLEVVASDWDTTKVVRGIGSTSDQVTLRLWLTDEETFEEERKRNEEYWNNN